MDNLQQQVRTTLDQKGLGLEGGFAKTRREILCLRLRVQRDEGAMSICVR